MAFHSERLTGRRARKWKHSLTWRDTPANLPQVLKTKVRKFDQVRAWGRVKTESGKFHYVILVRQRLVMLSHLIDRKKANEMAQNFDSLGGDGSVLRCEVCERLFDSWKLVNKKDTFQSLPLDFQAAMKARRPPLEGHVIGLTTQDKKESWRTGTEILPITRTPDVDGVEHPKPWEEPPSVALRWYKARRQNGQKGYSLVRHLVKTAIKTVLPFVREVGPAGKLVVADHSRKRVWQGQQMAGVQEVEVGWSRTAGVSVTMRFNVFNWYVRVYRRNRVIHGKWLILTPGKTENPDDPVPCDALNLEELETAYRNANIELKTPKMPTAGSGAATLRLQHGVLFRDAGVWKFTPTCPPSNNKIDEKDQIVPDNRVGEIYTDRFSNSEVIS